MSKNNQSYTERQRREIEYHRVYAKKLTNSLDSPISYDIISSKNRHWWSAHWEMYSFLLKHELAKKKILVVGCGLGHDALYLSKMGADVEAFDLSTEMIAIAKKLADREKLKVNFYVMPAEDLDFKSDLFDCVLLRDVLHHINISIGLKEIVRVSKKGALFVANEIYTHSIADKIRHSSIVDRYIYPRMKNFVYNNNYYCTEDERKLNEQDVFQIKEIVKNLEKEKYFNFFVLRFIPKKYHILSKIDRSLLMMLQPVSHLLGGRVVLAGSINK